VGQQVAPFSRAHGGRGRFILHRAGSQKDPAAGECFAVVTSLVVCSHSIHGVEFVVSLGLGIRLFLSDPKKIPNRWFFLYSFPDPKGNELLFKVFRLIVSRSRVLIS
jgi:hypothetical protein